MIQRNDPYGVSEDDIEHALIDLDGAVDLLRRVIRLRLVTADGDPTFIPLLATYWHLREMQGRRDMERVNIVPPYPKFPERR